MTGATTAARPTRDPATWRRWVPRCFVVLVTGVVFWPSLAGDFVWDDAANLVQNPRIRGFTPQNLAWMWSELRPHYMPLTWMSYALDHALCGFEARAFHAGNVAWHALNALLVACLLEALLERLLGLGPGARRSLGAAFGALVFAIHPLRVESVAWITERRDLVAGCFAIGSVLALLKARGRDGTLRRPLWWCAWLLFVLSLLAKTIAAGLPVVLLCLAGAERGHAMGHPGLHSWHRLRRECLDLWPFWLAAIGGVFLAWKGQVASESLGPQLVWWQSALQPGYRLLFYLGKVLWPVGLSPLYLFRAEEAVSAATVGATAAVLLGSLGLLVWARRRAGPWRWWLAFVLSLAPALGLVQFSYHFAADRNTYLAGVVVAFAFAGLLPARFLSPARGALLAVLVIAPALVLTTRQIRVWRDESTLWSHALSLDPGNHVALYNRGVLSLASGDHQAAERDLEAAVTLRPLYARAWMSLGILSEQEGDRTRAFELFSRAIAGDPDYAVAWYNRANVRDRKSDLDGILADYTRALELDPTLHSAYLNRAAAHQLRRDWEQAERDLTRALELYAALPEAWVSRGLLRQRRGDAHGARHDLERALELDLEPSLRSRAMQALQKLRE